MRQSVVAVNFGDLLQLKQAVGRVLDGLLHVWSEDRDVFIHFDWSSNGWSMLIKSANSDLHFDWGVLPQGVSSSDWVRLIWEELQNHLLSGGRFTVLEVVDDVEQRPLRSHLQRT